MSEMTADGAGRNCVITSSFLLLRYKAGRGATQGMLFGDTSRGCGQA